VELLGRGSLLVALAAALYAAGAGAYGAYMRDRRIVESAQRALIACFGAVLLAACLLWYAFVTHDFRFNLVAEYSSRALPLGYRFSALWGSQAGSLVLWLLILTGYSALVVRQSRRRNRELAPWVTAIMGGIAAFFALALVVASSPFATSAAPADGNGLNPSLQNPYMMIHPPMLYLGYVGFSVPFAYAMAALLAGQADERWIVSTRRWTLAAWSFLGIGMLLGAHWAYVEVGWGGFWGWDPVENAALVPWLVGTAFLHSVIVQEKKGMLKVWNVSLIALTFCLSILGTLLTRSGIVASVHAFVFSSIGWWFVAALVLAGAFSIVVISTHLPLLRARHRIESVISREATFLFNNLLLVALAFAVLWGVLFPVLSDAVANQEISVSKPYYDFFAVAFGLPLLFLAGVGPVIAWRRSSLRSAGRVFLWPFVSAAASTALLLLFGYGSSPPGVVAISLCLFVAVTVVLELVRGTRARKALSPGISWPRALAQLVGRNRRRYGGYVVHLAVVVGIVGIVGSTAYSTHQELRLNPGESTSVDGYQVRYVAPQRVSNASYVETRALLEVRHGGTSLGQIAPARREYLVEGVPSNEVAIHSDLRTGADFYAILSGIDGNGRALMTLIVNPLVNLLWLAGFLLALGVGIAIWPDPREARRLATRFSRDPAALERR
jgi:cytochrome c-type biogenesis protein CcmF